MHEIAHSFGMDVVYNTVEKSDHDVNENSIMTCVMEIYAKDDRSSFLWDNIEEDFIGFCSECSGDMLEYTAQRVFDSSVSYSEVTPEGDWE